MGDGTLSDTYAPTIDNTNVKSLDPVVTAPGLPAQLQPRDMTYAGAQRRRPRRRRLRAGHLRLPDGTNGDGTPVFPADAFKLSGLTVIDSGSTVTFQVGVANLVNTFGSPDGAQLGPVVFPGVTVP